jgi:hypothetical protein
MNVPIRRDKGELFDHRDAHLGDAGTVQAHGLGGAIGEVDDAATHEGAAVVDADDNGSAGAQIGNAYASAEFE